MQNMVWEILNQFKEHIESFNNARTLAIKEEDKKYIDDLFLLTMKPVMYVCNVDEKSAIDGNMYVERIRESLQW